MFRPIMSIFDRSFTHKAIITAVCSALLLSLATVSMADEENSRLYRTRVEKREAGVKHQWTPWLSTTSLAELEWVSERLRNPVDEVKFEDTIATLQLAAKLEPFENLVGELVLEYETEKDRVEIDEAALEIGHDEWQIALGKYYLPFGEYYSSFITDPILQLGEVRSYATTLSYEFNQDFELSIFGYRSIYDKNVEFGISLDSKLSDNAIIQLGYINEFTADEDPLIDGVRTVPALTGHLVWLADDFEVSFEALGAIETVSDEASARSRPLAWNLELTYIPHTQWDITLRIEGSDDVIDTPKIQYGIALNTRLHKNITFGIEALHGRFSKYPNAEGDDTFDHINTLSAQLVIAF